MSFRQRETGLLGKRVRELRDPQICGVESLRALGVQAKSLLVEAHGFVEIERGFLELVGDRREGARPGPQSRSRNGSMFSEEATRGAGRLSSRQLRRNKELVRRAWAAINRIRADRIAASRQQNSAWFLQTAHRKEADSGDNVDLTPSSGRVRLSGAAALTQPSLFPVGHVDAVTHGQRGYERRPTADEIKRGQHGPHCLVDRDTRDRDP